MTVGHRHLPYRALPVLRAENAEVLIHPDDRKFGALLVGSMGSGKTAAMLRMYLNDLRDVDAAIIVIDPKSELSRLCLALTPPDGPKRVWFLDLGRPAFGMSPLRLSGDGPLPIQAAAIAENVVAALLDINENQIFQSSRRYLYHAVIGAIALAERHQRRAKFEDVYSLLLPMKEDFRNAVAEACADQPDLDQTAEFFRSELPNDLRMATSAIAQRLDAPRNKVAGLTGVPPLRRFFNHPTDISLREILEARDVLIVDANMGAIGEDNSKACMHFLLRTLHTQMQRQVHLPETDRPRVPLLVDEAHYVAGAENVVDQIATHRRAGLETAFGLQYFAQLGSGSNHEEKIRKGVLNLLQSRFLFRMGDVQDAEEATRIAMAVYSTMIRDDPDSRARLRVTPEQALNFPNHHCLASWIAMGSRIPSFMGQTYAFPTHSDAWAEHHLAHLAARVAPYPEELESTLDRSARRPAGDGDDRDAPANANGAGAKPRRARVASGSAASDGARPAAPRQKARSPNGRSEQAHAPSSSRSTADEPIEPSGPCAPGSNKREVRVDYEAPPAAPNVGDSPVRRLVGRQIPGAPCRPRDDVAAPDSLRELAFLDRVNEIGPPRQLDGAAKLPRMFDEDYSILALLDRAGLAPRSLIGRAVLPGRGANAVISRLTKLYRHGLIAQHTIGIREHSRADGRPPLLYSLTRRGLEVAQAREPAPAISPKREWRPIEQRRAARLPHDLHALGWAIAFHRTVGPLATDRWRTPRYATGRYPVPQVGSGQRRHPITLNEIPVPDGQAIIDVELKAFTEVKPDLSLELRIDALSLTFDLLVELDLTARPSYNRDKLLAYDAFLCGWSLAHSRFRTQGTRPAVVFVCRDPHAALACAREADEALTGRIGVMGTPAEHWYFAGRDHMFFAREPDIHHSDLSALALPPLPPSLRERLTGARDLELASVELLPESVVAARRRLSDAL
jgi:Replication-relaxation/Type IV secretion-system coupling protein DNA-binding domain